jgi:beta-lactamase regulating signal transducer with metallopeptidase domain
MTGPAAAGTLGFFAGCFLKTAVVLTLALVAAAAARRRPACVRHFILSSALIGLLLIPLLSLAPVGWRSPLLPGWMAAPAASAAGGSVAPAAQSVRVSNSRLGEIPGAGPVAAASPSSVPVRLLVRRSGTPPLAAAADLAPAAGQASAAKTAPGGPFAAAGLAVTLLWTAGLAALLVRLAFGLAGAVRLTAEGTPLDGAAWRVLVERFIALVSLRREVRLKSHPEVLVPLTWGWRRPVVLLPEGSDSWTDDERASALFHELSHVKRADFLIMLLVRASLALFWWNPLCWIVYRELQKEQEIACDELVLSAGIRPSTYAATLLAFRRSAGFRWNPSAALLGMLGKSSFQERLAAILKQKLTFMEVKMKTKIMLALALVLAVALVGTARPVSATEAKVGKTVLAETAMPAPAGFVLAAPAVDDQEVTAAAAVVREQEQEKAKASEKAKQAEKAKAAEKAQKEKAAVATTYVISPVKVEGKPIEVVITEGGQAKTLILEKPLTITKSKDGEALVLTVDGKDIRVVKGEPLRLEIKGGELQVLKEGATVVAGRPMKVKLDKQGGEEGQTIVFYGTTDPEIVTEKIRLAEKVEAAEEPGQVIVKTRKDMKEGERWLSAPAKEAKVVEGQPYAWTIQEGGHAVVGKAGTAVWVAEGGPAYAYATGMRDEEMLKRVQALQEQVQAIKAKKMDLSALEESLKKLEVELQAKEEKLKEIKSKLERVPGEPVLIKKVRETEAEGGDTFVITEDKPVRPAKGGVFVATGDKNEGTINLVFTGHEGEAGQAAFERAVTTLKKELPEGYTLVEQKFDGEDGTMTFKVAPPEGKKTDGTFIKKLVEMVQEQINKK